MHLISWFLPEVDAPNQLIFARGWLETYQKILKFKTIKTFISRSVWDMTWTAINGAGGKELNFNTQIVILSLRKKKKVLTSVIKRTLVATFRSCSRACVLKVENPRYRLSLISLIPTWREAGPPAPPASASSATTQWDGHVGACERGGERERDPKEEQH